MTSTLNKGTVLVVGGTGSIGSAIMAKLLHSGYSVAVMSRGSRPPDRKAKYDAGPNVSLYEIQCDATDAKYVPDCFTDYISGLGKLVAIVYSVGHCPPGGFDAEVGTPLTDLQQQRLTDEFSRQVIGLHNVCSSCCGYMETRGHIVVIGSAITRLTDEQCPPWLHAGQYAIAKAAQDELVRWLRRDPFIQVSGILVHRIAPAAVDTPFHHGCVHQPPVMLSVDVVAEHVLRALESETIVDEMLLPSPPA